MIILQYQTKAQLSDVDRKNFFKYQNSKYNNININIRRRCNYRTLTGERADLSLGPLAHIIGGQEDKKNADNNDDDRG